MALRLRFSIPEFLRVVWATAPAKEVWEPRIRRIVEVWSEIERLAVVERMKPATLQICPPDQLPELSLWAMRHGLVLVPLSAQGILEGYTNSVQKITPGKSWGYRYVIGRLSAVEPFLEAWAESDNDRMGALLGFPKCCRNFFQEVWIDRRWEDTTLPMAYGVSDVDSLSHITPFNRVGGPIECNILLRWIGVRAVSHLPCSFYCLDTQRIGHDLLLLGESKFKKEVAWIEEMLDWPVQWSSLHGVATITTPCFKLVVDSTALASKVVVERDGGSYPGEGARGNSFPFKQLHRLTVHRKDEHSDNGFQSRDAMDRAHNVVVEVVVAAIGDKSNGVDFGKVIDLGCGNGLLLEKIVERAPWLVPCGIEKDSGKHQRAARRLLAYDPDLHVGDLHDDRHWNPPYSVGVLSLARLKEVDMEDARALLARLRDGCYRVVIYSYDHGKWPEGFEWVFDFFHVALYHSDGGVFATLCKPRRDNDSDPVQR